MHDNTAKLSSHEAWHFVHGSHGGVIHIASSAADQWNLAHSTYYLIT